MCVWYFRTCYFRISLPEAKLELTFTLHPPRLSLSAATDAETVIMPFAHNPTIRRDPKTGTFVLYMIGNGGRGHAADCKNRTGSERALQLQLHGRDEGKSDPNNETTFTASIYVSSATSIHGPWTTPEAVVFSGTSELLGHGRSNPSPHFEEDGSVLLAFVSSPDKKGKGPLKEYSGVVRSPPRTNGKPAWIGPFELLSEAPLLPPHFWCVAGTGEDPFLWRDARGLKVSEGATGEGGGAVVRSDQA